MVSSGSFNTSAGRRPYVLDYFRSRPRVFDFSARHEKKSSIRFIHISYCRDSTIRIATELLQLPNAASLHVVHCGRVDLPITVVSSSNVVSNSNVVSSSNVVNSSNVVSSSKFPVSNDFLSAMPKLGLNSLYNCSLKSPDLFIVLIRQNNLL